MKKIITFVLMIALTVSFISCNFNANLVTDINYSEVDNVELLEYLKNNISENSTVDEITDVFEEMCKKPIEEELLLLEYGVYGFTGEELFYFDLVRQYPDGEDEYYQLRVSLMFTPDEENRKLHETLWNDEVKGNFFDHIRTTSGYNYAKNNKFKSIDIRIDQT